MRHTDGYWQRLMRQRVSRRRMMRGAAVGGLGLAAAAAIGCGEEEESGPTPTATATQATPTGTAAATGTAAPQVRRGGSTIIPVGNLTAVLDPHTDLNQAIWVWNIMGNLAIYPDGPTFTLDPTISLVESWEIPGDGTEIILRVRQGVKWHNRPPTNGRELTAEDIAFNIMRIAGKLDPDNASRYQRRSNFVNMNRAEAVDQYTVKVTMDKPSSAFLRGFADWRNSIIAPEQIDVGFNDPAKFVGTGPFTIDRWEDNGQRAEFRKNPDFWQKGVDGQPLPYIDSVRWNYLPDRSTILSAFISKEVDWLGAPSKTERQTISGAFRDAVLESWTFGNWQHLRFNTRVKPFDDVRVRKAIFMAIDYKDINDAFHGDGFWEYTGPLPAAFREGIPSAEIAQMPGWNPATKQQDIARAKQIMSEAGYADPDFSMKMLPPSNATTGYYYETGIRLKDQFSKIWPNLKAELDIPPDGATFAKRQVEGDFETILYIIFPQPDAVLELHSQYHTSGSRNYGKFSDPDIDARLESALLELNDESRAAILREVQMKIINDFMPTITTAMPKYLYFVNPRIKGFSGLSGPGSFGGYDPGIYAHRYWIA